MADPTSFEGRHISLMVDDLNDHRHQPEHLPRADQYSSPLRSHGRRGTSNSHRTIESPVLLQVDEALRNGHTARDFEQAIDDDVRSELSSLRGVDGHYERPSFSRPQVARRSTFRRPPQPFEQRPHRSRTATLASYEDSPANSVDAFAEPRGRGRPGTAQTIQSPNPSLCSLSRHQSGSRRPTLSDERSSSIGALSRASTHESAEDDVCFPELEEPAKIYTIDFDELHEFVDIQAQQKTYSNALRRTCSSSCQAIPTPQESYKVRSQTQGFTTVVTDIPIIITDPSDVDEKMTPDVGVRTPGVDSDKTCVAECQPQTRPLTHRWSFFSSELEQSVHAADLGDLLLPGQTFFDLFALGPADGVWWLDMVCPTVEEVEVICKAFDIHRLTREDILEQETREKVELFRSYYFVCFRSFVCDQASEDYLAPVNIYAVVFQEGILTFSFAPSPHAANVRKRMGRLRDYASLGSNWICYALVDDIVDLFAPSIRELEHEIDAVEDDVFTVRLEDSRSLLIKISQGRRKILSLIRLLSGKADVIKAFAKRCNENYAIAPRQDIGLYLSDVQDHVVTMISNLGHFEKILGRSHSNYLAQISVDQIEQGNNGNQALRKVTMIATILVPLNLVTGLFGMNVNVPGGGFNGGGFNYDWFIGIVSFMIGFVLILGLVFKKLKWF